MSAPESTRELELAMDYGQFSLQGASDADADADADDDLDDLDDPEDLGMQTLDAAMDGPGIARTGNHVVVLSPHQNNFAMAVRVETWPTEPLGDLDGWEEVFEVSVRVAADGLRYDSPTTAGHRIDLAPGLYALRISGRGFVARGWPGSTRPGDVWRWQVWPTDVDIPPRRLRAWAG